MKLKQIPNGLKIILIVSVLLAIADFTTAFMNKGMLQYLETNPLYIAFKSMIPLIILNICFIYLIYRVYLRYPPFIRYACCSYFVWLSVLRIYAIRSNILAYLNPPTLEAAKQLTTAVKIQAYSYVYLAYLIPFLLSVAIYLLWKLDHNVENKSVGKQK